MAEHDKEKTFLQKFGKEKFGEKLMNMNNPLEGGFNMPEPTPPTVNMSQMKPRMEDLAPFGEMGEQRLNSVRDAEEDRFKKMQMLNGNTFENGERSQGDQEAEQRMVQNKKTGLLQKFVDKIKEGFSEVKAGLGENPFNKALEKEFGTEDQPKYGGKDAVMYNGKFVHPDFYKLIMNRPDLKQRFDRTGSIYGD